MKLNKTIQRNTKKSLGTLPMKFRNTRMNKGEEYGVSAQATSTTDHKRSVSNISGSSKRTRNITNKLYPSEIKCYGQRIAKIREILRNLKGNELDEPKPLKPSESLEPKRRRNISQHLYSGNPNLVCLGEVRKFN